jgi:subtilisin-like proprotein convertase family protein
MYRSTLLLTVLAASTGCTQTYEPDDAPGPGDQAPTISFTSPTDGLAVSRVIEVSASASGSGGIVASVAFDLPNGVHVIDTAPPFQTTWDTTTVADGSYVIQAAATDDHGITRATSARVTVTNDLCVDDTFSATIPAPIDIPDSASISSSLSVTGNGDVALLLLSLSIKHGFRRDLQVALISPGGTSYALGDQGNLNINIDNQLITAFNDEPAAGSWRLVVHDGGDNGVGHARDLAGGAGTLEAWSLTIIGSCDPSGQ